MTFWVFLICGLVLFTIGIYLQISKKFSVEIVADRFGNISSRTIDGFSGIFVGVIILSLSVWIYFLYKEEKNKIDRLN